MSEPISLEGLDKAEVLMALYDAARPQGMGFLRYIPGPMPREEAERLVRTPEDDVCDAATREMFRRKDLYFDYIHGRVMKVNLSGDSLDPIFYDRDNGPGAAAAAIARLRARKAARP